MGETKKRTINYMDSLEVSRNFSAAPKLIKAYMEKRHKDKGEEEEYRIKIRTDLPMQTNGVDCGVFVCKYAERITSQDAVDFRQEDMADARKKMTKELLEGKLIPWKPREREQGNERESTRGQRKKTEKKRKK